MRAPALRPRWIGGFAALLTLALAAGCAPGPEGSAGGVLDDGKADGAGCAGTGLDGGGICRFDDGRFAPAACCEADGSEGGVTACPEAVAFAITECVTESWSEVPDFPAIQGALDYCTDLDAAEWQHEIICEDEEAPAVCAQGVEYFGETLLPGCRAAETPMILVNVQLEDYEMVPFDEDDYDAPHDEGWYDYEGTPTYRDESLLLRGELPYRLSVGNYFVSISEAGQVRFEYSYGDADGTVDAALDLPSENGQLTAGAGVYQLAISGGDNASGAWGANGLLQIEIAR